MLKENDTPETSGAVLVDRRVVQVNTDEYNF